MGGALVAIAESGSVAGLVDGGLSSGLAALGAGSIEVGALACAGMALSGALVVGGLGWGMARMYRQCELQQQYRVVTSSWHASGYAMPKCWELKPQ